MRRLLSIALLLASCTSDPYVVHTLVDKDKNQRIERICTHKTAVIPWYAVVAGGFFTWKYGQECQLKTTPLNAEAAPVVATTNTDDARLEAQKAAEKAE